MTEQRTSIMLRLPRDLALWVKHQAVDNYRSFNGEIVHRLEKSRVQQESKQPQGAQQ